MNKEIKGIQDEDPTTQKYTHYIVVVHGIGDQRKNETVLSVVNRFAEARRDLNPKDLSEILTLGRATGQTGTDEANFVCRIPPKRNMFTPWMEFEGIPQKSVEGDPLDHIKSQPFLGDASKNGENLRFVDMCWADILKGNWISVGQPVEIWANGLLGRIQRKSFFINWRKNVLKWKKRIANNEQFTKEEIASALNISNRLKYFIINFKNEKPNLNIDDWILELKSISSDLSAANPSDKNTVDVFSRLIKLFADISLEINFAYPLSNLVPVPFWVLKTLENLANTLIFLRKVMSFRIKKIEEMVFNQFLGDVQLYGEFPRIRGKAARRFHRLMALIEQTHEKLERGLPEDQKSCPKYTIIAHSLGTVMSLDALMYATVDPILRAQSFNDTSTSNIPFPGYIDEDPEEIQNYFELKRKNNSNKLSEDERIRWKNIKKDLGYLDTDWINRVDSFVTLGSPIDKFLVMWWLNYKYLQDNSVGRRFLKGKNNQRIENPRKIRQYNYCDEQDPVGHQLEVARGTPAFKNLFQPMEDIVFNRYPAPGAAHMKYWNDLKLFKRIIHYAVDNHKTAQPNPPKWFSNDVYRKVIKINYWMIPCIILLADFFTFTWAIYADSKHSAVLATVIFVGTCWVGRKLIDLLVWWRQTLRLKAESYWGEIRERLGRDPKPYEVRKMEGTKFKRILATVPILLILFSGISFSLLFHVEVHMEWLKTIVILIVPLFIIFFYGVLLDFKTKEIKEEEPILKESFKDVDLPVVFLASLPVLLGLLLHFKAPGLESVVNYLQNLFNEPETLYIDIVFNLTALLFIGVIVFSYLWMRFRQVKKDLKYYSEVEEGLFKSHAPPIDPKNDPSHLET